MRLLQKLILPIFFFLVHFSYAQGEAAQTLKWFDQVIGKQNTAIFNGIDYIEEHRTINEKHKYFLSSAFLPGTVHYDKQLFPDVKLRYNIFEDLLMVNIEEEGREAFFQLLKSKVDRFTVSDRMFYNIREHEDFSGFSEILLETEALLLLKKHSLRMNKKKDRFTAYYEFEVNDPTYILLFQDEYYKLDSRRDVIRIFPDLKEEIRAFYSSHKSLRKRSYDDFIKGLFEIISQKLTR